MRLIDADAYIKYCEENWIPLNVDAVKAQPTADVVERKKGKWKMEWHCFLHREIPMCSQCLRVSAFKYNFCPYCGADMREENSK